ncbi:MAG: PTS system mannose/fructose/sorbose family transporter subunit IID [Gemmatimonadetes bacterium]|nr:PTS system mannose/fructose/sorbose family transporter subunit IID [Gemmatimonadota bacterium]
MKRGMIAAALRLFVIQGSMNHERLQGLGAAVAIEPLVRDLPRGATGDGAQGAVARAAGFFNTHPYLAGLAVGALAKAEHEGVPPNQVERLRSALKGPLGSIGDRLIWAGTLPALSAGALVLTTVTPPLVAVAAFLVGYNTVHLLVRWWALQAGWRSGMTVGRALRNPVLRGALRIVGPLAALSVGFALPVLAARLTAGFDAVTRWGTAGIGLATVLVTWWLVPTIGAARFGLLTLGAVFVLGWLW